MEMCWIPLWEETLNSKQEAMQVFYFLAGLNSFSKTSAGNGEVFTKSYHDST